MDEIFLTSEVIVMASTCDACGYCNYEYDLASVKVRKLTWRWQAEPLGGIVTTVEGLITRISESLERVHGFTFGDDLDENSRSKWIDFKARLNKVLDPTFLSAFFHCMRLLSLEEPWTLILDDALANSFVAHSVDDTKEDNQLAFEDYERSWEQNEELGPNDMDTSSAEVGDAPTNTSKTE
ncbi:hypothetical protein ACSQ67_024759 [Phaseolus vulgaris]